MENLNTLLDGNALSELTKARPNPGVMRMLADCNAFQGLTSTSWFIE